MVGFSANGQTMKSSSSGTNQHAVNLAVLLVSAAMAWVAPLQTFIVAYAVIGGSWQGGSISQPWTFYDMPVIPPPQ